MDLLDQRYTNHETLVSDKQLLTAIFPEIDSFDDLVYDFPLELCQEDHTKLTKFHSEISKLVSCKEEIFCSSSLSSDVINNDSACIKVEKKWSTTDILRLAGEKYIQSSCNDLSMTSHRYSRSFFGLYEEKAKDIELLQNLLASAEKVGEKQFERAGKLIEYCHDYSSIMGRPVQRLVYYFSEALRQRIEQETGRKALEDSGNIQSLALQDALNDPSPNILAIYQQLPFSQVSLFTAMQAIVDNVSEAKRIHVIDLDIRCGLHFPVLMEALATRFEGPVEHLKVTAVGTRLKHKIEKTGKRLMSVAQSLNLSFSFDIVMVDDMLDISDVLFELDTREIVTVYGAHILSTMLQTPDKLEKLMKVIREINPCVMVVTEEWKLHNSPIFVNSFVEALFYYGAFFDSIEECMDGDDPNRMLLESMTFGPSITNIVAAEGEERIKRHVNTDVWKAFFARFGMAETELSRAALYQASLLVANFACASSCTVGMLGKSLTVGWKGTPIYSTCACKFIM